MNQQLRQYLESIGLRSSASKQEAWRFYGQLGGQQRQEAKALKRPQQPAANGGGATADPSQAGDNGNQRGAAGGGGNGQPSTDAERQRVREIMAMRDAGASETLVRQAVDNGASVDEARRQWQEEITGSRHEPVAVGGSGGPGGPGGGAPNVNTHGRSDALQSSAAAIGLALTTSNDAMGVARSYVSRQLSNEEREREAERLCNMADEHFRGITPMGLARACLEQDGQRASFDDHVTAQRAVSTASFSNAMTDNVRARLMRAFTQSPDTTQGFTSEADVLNYRQNERHQVGKVGQFEKRPRGQNAAYGTMDDRAPETYRVFQYAKQFWFDEQDIVDDNLDAIQRVPDEMGFGAARIRPDLVYYILLANGNMADGNSLFDNSNHANADTNAFGATNLEAGVEKMAIQTQDGVNLNLTPTTLIVPHALRFKAQRELESAERRDSQATQGGTRNVLADLEMGIAADGRIDNGVTDPDSDSTASGSSSTWFLAANPQVAPVIEVGFIRGAGRQPMMTRWTKNGEDGAFGVGWSVKHAIGAAPLDWRGLYRGNT